MEKINNKAGKKPAGEVTPRFTPFFVIPRRLEEEEERLEGRGEVWELRREGLVEADEVQRVHDVMWMGLFVGEV